MQSILEQITDWLKSMIISGIMGNLSGMFDLVNQQVGQIAGDVGTTPANFSPAFFSMIRNILKSVLLPIAGMVLTFIACYELIQMLIEHTGQNHLRSLFALRFQGFLIMICVGIYAVLIQNLSFSDNIISSVWGDTVLLVFIQQAISELTKGKTIITIAHRLATIRNADQILVVDDGRIAECGTHEELIAQGGIYKRFTAIRQQAEGWKL